MIEELVYKKKPILKITGEGYTKLFIGLKKAQLIIQEIEAIKSFITSHIDKDITITNKEI